MRILVLVCLCAPEHATSLVRAAITTNLMQLGHLLEYRRWAFLLMSGIIACSIFTSGENKRIMKDNKKYEAFTFSSKNLKPMTEVSFA